MSAELIGRFYEAFSEQDGAAMAACYHPQARFSDPVFPDLQGSEIGAMWQMLCEQGDDLAITFGDVSGDESTGTAHWEATYSFGPGKRMVHNRIDAEFEFADGLIKRHVDTFDLWAWTRMALGPAGVFLGWTPWVRGQVRGRAQRSLERWMDTNPTGDGPPAQE